MLKERQIHFLEVLRETDGFLLDSFHKAPISKQTYYNWFKNPEFKEKAEEILGEKKKEMDFFVESKLFSLIKNNCVPAILFYLRMKHPEYNLQRIAISKEENPFERLTDDELKRKIRETAPRELETGITEKS